MSALQQLNAAELDVEKGSMANVQSNNSVPSEHEFSVLWKNLTYVIEKKPLFSSSGKKKRTILNGLNGMSQALDDVLIVSLQAKYKPVN